MKCVSWEFDGNDNLGNTWTSEWNLVCDKEYMYVKFMLSKFLVCSFFRGGIRSENELLDLIFDNAALILMKQKLN